MDKHKISTIMPVKDCEAFLGEAIKSILEQSYENLELILMDNGSSDGSWDIMMDFKASDKRIRVVRNRNVGLTASMNLMIDMAQGEYIARIDSDDLADRERFRIQYESLIENEHAVLSTGRCKIIDEEGSHLYEHGPDQNILKLKWNLLFKNEIWHSSVMWRNGRGIKYNSSFAYAQDYELWSRVSRRWDMVSCDKVIGTIRKRRGSISSEKKAAQNEFALEISKSNIEHYLGKTISKSMVEQMRNFHEFKRSTKGAEKTYEELSIKFHEIWQKKEERKPIKIRIGKKQESERNTGLNIQYMEEKIAISKKRWNRSKRKSEGGINYIWLDREERYVEVEIRNHEISPAYGLSTEKSPWEGFCQRKPWDYTVTVVIPCLNTPETLPICVNLWRLQTIKPFIMIIDTGSTEKNLRLTEEMRSEDVEVHSIRLNGVRHPSDYPAMAMDLAFSMCRSEYLFATHSDCFPRRRDLLESFLGLCKTKSPVVGYELSPRAHEDWVGMVSHTASMYHMPTMDNIGFGWSLRRLCNRYGIVDYKPDPNKPNWPDTEILGNYILRDNGIMPHLVGKEGNHCRTLDENIDHFRSYGAAKMYSPEYYPKVLDWYHMAKSDALKRIDDWSGQALA